MTHGTDSQGAARVDNTDMTATTEGDPFRLIEITLD